MKTLTLYPEANGDYVIPDCFFKFTEELSPVPGSKWTIVSYNIGNMPDFKPYHKYRAVLRLKEGEELPEDPKE